MFNQRSKLEVAAFFAVFIIIIIFLSTKAYPSKLILGGKLFNIEVVDTKKLLEKGLSGHKPLLEDEGMFFVFQKEDLYGFWMKDMSFSIDILWIDSNFKIVHIEKSLSPETYPKIFYPKTKAHYVLEISAGEANKLDIKIGDSIKFIKNSS